MERSSNSSVARDTDGILRESGARLKDREHDFARCAKILDWGIELLNEKLAKPKYAGLSPALCPFVWKPSRYRLATAASNGLASRCLSFDILR